MLYSQYKELDSVIHVCDGNLCNLSPAEDTCASAAASYFSDVLVLTLGLATIVVMSI